MDSLGFILVGVNLIFPILIVILRAVNKGLVQATESINQEFANAYKELGRELGAAIANSTVVVGGPLESSLNRIKALHMNSPKDITKILLWTRFLDLVAPISTFWLLLAIAAIFIEKAYLGQTKLVVHQIFLGVPFITLVINLILLLVMLKIENNLGKLPGQYRGGGYRR